MEESDLSALVLCNFLGAGNQNLPRGFPLSLVPANTRENTSGKGPNGGTTITVTLLIDEIISFLLNNGINRIMLFCASFSEAIDRYISTKYGSVSEFSRESVNLDKAKPIIYVHRSASSRCSTLGDALREIGNNPSMMSWLLSPNKKPQIAEKAQRNNLHDFVFLEGDTLLFKYKNLRKEIQHHLTERIQNPKLLSTMIGTQYVSQIRSGSSESTAAAMHVKNDDCFTTVSTENGCYLLGKVSYPGLFGKSMSTKGKHGIKSGKIDISRSYMHIGQSFWKHATLRASALVKSDSAPSLKVSSYTRYSGISICSEDIFSVMRENFDFDSLEDCIRAYTIIHDDNLSQQDSAYDNEEMNRIINHFDIRMPLVAVADINQSSSVILMKIRDLLDVPELMRTLAMLQDSHSSRKKKNGVTLAALTKFYHSMHSLTDRTEQIPENARDSFECSQPMENLLLGFLDSLRSSQDIKENVPCNSLLKRSLSVGEKPRWCSDDIIEDFDEFSKRLVGNVNQENNYAQEKEISSNNYGLSVSSENTFCGEDHSLKMFDDLFSLLDSSVSSRLADHPASDGNHLKSIIDSSTCLETRMCFDDNDLRVSLSQVKFLHNESPFEFGSAFMVALFRIAMKASEELIGHLNDEKLRYGKAAQKIFKQYITVFSSFLMEERFGGCGNCMESEFHSKQSYPRIFLLLVELSEYPSLESRMPHILKFLYEAEIICEDEILVTHNIVIDHSRRTAAVDCNLPFMKRPSSSEKILGIWEGCIPLVDALREPE